MEHPIGDTEGDFTASDGARIHYWFYNRGTEIVTIFLHGGPGHGTEDFRSLQAKDYADAIGSLLVFDQRGSGESDRRATLASTITFPRMVSDIDELRHYVIGERPVVLFGRSFGGLLAAQYAYSQPDHVAGYILAVPGPFDAKVADAQRTILRASVDAAIIEQVARTEGETIRSRYTTLPTPPTEGPKTPEEAAAEPVFVNVGDALRAHEHFTEINYYHLLSAMAETPTLVAYGLYDTQVPPLSIDAMKPLLPNAIFLALEGTHFATYGQQELFFAAVQDFFAEMRE